MEVADVEWTALTSHFGYYTVSLLDVPIFNPEPFANAEPINPFFGWKGGQSVETFIGDIVEELMPDVAGSLTRSCWGNYYHRLKHHTVKRSHLPHVDGPGWIGNLWLTDHEPGTRSTRFFSYKDQCLDDKYTFFRDTMRSGESPKNILKQMDAEVEYIWENFSIEQIEGWGFQYLGEAPAKKDTITVYNAMMPHTAYIADNVFESYGLLTHIEVSTDV